MQHFGVYLVFLKQTLNNFSHIDRINKCRKSVPKFKIVFGEMLPIYINETTQTIISEVIMSYTETILNFLTKSEKKTGKPAVFDRTVAEKKYPWLFPEEIHGNVMRTARKLVGEKILTRVNRGEFKLSSKGRKLAF